MIHTNRIMMVYENGNREYPQGKSISGSPNQVRDRLELEIRNLRARMEQAASREKSMTSDLVIQLSRELDVKINEYMDHIRKNAHKS